MQPNQLNKRQQEQMQEIKKKMAEEINTLCQAAKFAVEFIHPQFADWLTLALPHETSAGMRTSYADFKMFWSAMITKPVLDYTLWEMGFAINCVEARSMHQMGVTTHDHYLFIQDALAEMTIKWNEQLNALKQPVVDRYKAMEERIKNGKPLFIPNVKIEA